MWVKYSKGKFGFSVQKEIYESLAGDTKNYNHEVFDKFYDRVGWKEGGDWVRYGDYTFNLNAPYGHLPFMIWGIRHHLRIDLVTDRVSIVCIFLFSRAKTCNL
ncbi:MAG: GUN4 domain-containing protein [Xenococcus sp. (in: cyanobacteria)]